MQEKPFVIPRRISFLAALAFGVSTVLVTVIVGATSIALYGMNVIDRRSDDAVSVVHSVVEQIPEIRKILPAAVVDAFDDRREPGYVDQLQVEVTLPYDSATARYRPVVTLVNRGEEVISLLNLRVVALTESGYPVLEQTTYAATPLAADDDWKGPLLPGSTRRFSLPTFQSREPVQATWEVTELRVWTPTSTEPI